MMKDKTNNCIMEPRHNNQFFDAVDKTLRKKKAKIAKISYDHVALRF